MENNERKNNSLTELMEASMSKIRDMVDSNTIIGEPIQTPDGVTLIPVSRLSFGSGCGARVYPVGRLDMDSEGLLLMTNDGAWMQRLLHPSREIEKEYRVTVTGPVEGAAGRLAAIRDLEGERIRPARVRELWRDGNKAALSVTIHEGKNRQIRRMCRQAGLAVRRLQRVREHTLTLGDLPVGRWRYLTQQELQMLEGSEKR